MRAGRRSGMPSIGREPLPRSALSSARLWPFVGPVALPPRLRLSTPLAWANLAVRPGPIPVHAPRCRRGALLWISASLADFCNRERRAGTPNELSSPRTRVGLSPRYQPAPLDAGCVGRHDALPHREPASHDQHATACVRRVPLAWTGADHGPKHPREGMVRASWTNVARALLEVLHAPESPARFAAKSGAFRVSPRRPRSAAERSLAKGCDRSSDRGAFRRAGAVRER